MSVDLQWQNHKLIAATLVSDAPRTMKVRSGDAVVTLQLPAHERIALDGSLHLRDATQGAKPNP